MPAEYLAGSLMASKQCFQLLRVWEILFTHQLDFSVGQRFAW
jgi:hypothetical protein